jgi:hypothetical protein
LLILFSVRYVGGGHRPQARGTGNGAPLRPSAASTDDLLLHDEDTRSVGASSYVSAAHSVVQLTARPPPAAAAVPQAVARRATFEISRESSKESSNSESDEQLDRGRGMSNSGHNRGDHQAVLKSRISQSSLSSEASRQSGGGGGGRATTPPLPPAHSPTASRRSTRLMVKSYSQDTPNELGKEGTNLFLF